ncbi:MAG: hypothetical protein K6A94_03035 [Bacteroidales bacterium]|nr:hypothetical protein [Bacteroidales bacterium]
MDYKKVFFIIGIALLFHAEAMCQCTTALSKTGNAHWRAAETLMGMASTADDYEQVAIELKQVAESDPNYAPVYMKLGKLYTQIGNDKGESAFDLAEYYYGRCQEVCPDSADAVVVEMAILNALRRKFANGPNRFAGTWGRWYEGKFTPYVVITYDGNSYSFAPRDGFCSGCKVIDRKTTATSLVLITEYVHDHRDELRKKGLTHYYGDRGDSDGVADPGYPSTGRYNYDKTISRYTNSYTIEGDAVYYRYAEYHADYYFNGQKTHAETDRSMSPIKLVKYQ